MPRIHAGDQLKRMLPDETPVQLIDAMYGGLLKASGVWSELTRLTLIENSHLEEAGFYDDLCEVVELTISHSKLINRLGDLPKLKRLEVNKVEDLSVFRALNELKSLESVLIRSLDGDQLISLAKYPELLALLEAGCIEREAKEERRKRRREAAAAAEEATPTLPTAPQAPASMAATTTSSSRFSGSDQKLFNLCHN